ncbi:MAG: hypothetical protein LBI62_02725 [Candidatus Accumulibacter sp.]|nr:hypothetical protein [Accumulibacter sp.]
MVIDTSAILAWLKNERERIVAALEAHPATAQGRRSWHPSSHSRRRSMSGIRDQ